ncbi:hypothetical protein KP509_20G018000 [Ceratopteris richardii]|uniref:HD domain-containing protein n=1 Tax=Ceratopteris richardii TaxID=49495 RepID=A0A8T2SF70_CERRI|nr:hypothetical protein KP509_20G018000 [Ceratopteris richardii]
MTYKTSLLPLSPILTFSPSKLGAKNLVKKIRRPKKMEAARRAVHASSGELAATSSFCRPCSTAVLRIRAKVHYCDADKYGMRRPGDQGLCVRRHEHVVTPIMASSDGAPPLRMEDSSSSSACIAPSSAIDFLMLCQRLKATKRTGWVNHGLKDTESIADHMHRMAVMAIIAAGVPGVDRDKCVKMAVVHDIAEGKDALFNMPSS